MARINKSRGPVVPSDTEKFNPKLISPNIRVKDLDTMVYQQGVRVKVYKTLWCPNVKSIDGMEHEINCPLCRGTEFIDTDCEETLAFIQGQQREHKINLEEIGTNWEEQTVLATFLSGVELTYYTKVELMDYTNLFVEMVQRQVTGGNAVPAFTPTGYDAETGYVTVDDTVDLYQVRNNMVFLDADNNRFAIEGTPINTTGSKKFFIGKDLSPNIGGASTIIIPDVDRLKFSAYQVNVLIDKCGDRYHEGQDFVIDRNGDIEWLSCPDARKPADASIYTIHYDTLVAFRAIRAIHSNRFLSNSEKRTEMEVVEAPQQWMLKKLYLFDKKDSESGQKLDPNKIFEPGDC